MFYGVCVEQMRDLCEHIFLSQSWCDLIMQRHLATSRGVNAVAGRLHVDKIQPIFIGLSCAISILIFTTPAFKRLN